MPVLDLDRIFTYHPPSGNQRERYEQLRNEALHFAQRVTELVPDSRERAVALTNIQQAVMWANAGIAVTEA